MRNLNFDHRKKHNINKRNFLLEIKKFKGGQCEICGYNKNFACLDFHHLTKKNFSINSSSVRYLSEEEITDEVRNCRLLCKNCHNDLHHPHLRQL